MHEIDYTNWPLIKSLLAARTVSLIDKTKRKIIDAEGPFTDIMLKISIIKLFVTFITLIVMTVLFFVHLNDFASMATQIFSKWFSTPLVGFIIMTVIIKFVAISIGITLTMPNVKFVTVEFIRSRLEKLMYKNPRKIWLGVFLRRRKVPLRI